MELVGALKKQNSISEEKQTYHYSHLVSLMVLSFYQIQLVKKLNAKLVENRKPKLPRTVLTNC
jgi:hypothetical protein